MQLKLTASPKHGGPSRLNQENSAQPDDSEEEDDNDDDEDVMESTENLNRTLCEIIEGKSL